MDTTYDMARRCPKCGELGEITSKQPFRGVRSARTVTRGAELHTATCQNERCRWYGTACRVFQVNPDGTIPPAMEKRDKQFPAIPDMTKQVQESLDRQLGLEVAGGGEVSNR